MIDNYSRFVLRAIPPLRLSMHPPENPDTPPEALSREEKGDLLAFLRRL